jgi:quercetin dioxygenase-like cupin family protein
LSDQPSRTVATFATNFCHCVAATNEFIAFSSKWETASRQENRRTKDERCGSDAVRTAQTLYSAVDVNADGGFVMEIHTAGSRPTRRGPPDYFTGTVWQDPIVAAPAPARLNATRVTFEPGARTAWHTHPLGQTLYVISGIGRVQSKGGPIREIRPGDMVWIPPHEKHWHGASATSGMVHIAMQEGLDGSYAEWLDKVTDTEYGVVPTA